MVYTSYTEKEFDELPDYYKKQVVGIKDAGEIMQPPLCPECSSPMMEVDKVYLSCVECALCRKARILK